VKLKQVRDIIYRAKSLLRPIFLVGLLALFALILKSIPLADQDWLVKLVQGLAVVFLLFSAIKEFAPNDLIKKAATWILIPLALLMVFGVFDEFTAFLNSVELMAMGKQPITLMTVTLLVIFGALFFKIGNLLNARGQDVIRAQDALDVTTREVAAKLFQIVLFALVFILVLGAAKVPLSGLVVIFSALSLGIGLGLQPIAANFVSGLIILFDRSVKVGDFVMMEDEKFGRVKAINMRSTTVATADGKDVIVPNTSFTEGAYENWTHDDPLQRYEVDFTVSYGTDLDALVPIVRDAILEHPDFLAEPDLPSIEFRSFGESGINMCVEFWCLGVDDGPNKFTSDAGFIIWRTLKAHNIEIPYPQHVIHMKKP
jgi:small-conductance mechanosensitive channel